MTRFLHTSDWQLGMTRRFLSEGAQERYAQARFDSIRAMGRIAKDEDCRFMLVCGDAFESNQVDRRTVARALEALKDVPVPVYILPGNHDPLNAASVYRSGAFLERKPPHVHILENAAPVRPADDVELVGGVWTSKRPVVNPAAEALEALAPANDVVRICAAHGAVDRLAPDPEAAGVIELAAIEAALADGRIHYAALGDRHSATGVSENGRVWYSGTPETTDFSEIRSGYALVVDVDAGSAAAREVRVGQWQFVRHEAEVNAAEDVALLAAWLEAIENKERTVVRLELAGSLALSAREALDRSLAAARDLFAAFEARDELLLAVPEDADFADLGFSGFADATVERLRAAIQSGGDAPPAARDALMLLLRLARRVA